MVPIGLLACFPVSVSNLFFCVVFGYNIWVVRYAFHALIGLFSDEDFDQNTQLNMDAKETVCFFITFSLHK